MYYFKPPRNTDPEIFSNPYHPVRIALWKYLRDHQGLDLSKLTGLDFETEGMQLYRDMIKSGFDHHAVRDAILAEYLAQQKKALSVSVNDF